MYDLEGYCKHGVYVGGSGIDWMCGRCEDGDTSPEEEVKKEFTFTYVPTIGELKGIPQMMRLRRADAMVMQRAFEYAGLRFWLVVEEVVEEELDDHDCWYCREPAEDFSWEFDCFVHESCIQKRLQQDPDDGEASIMAREFDLI